MAPTIEDVARRAGVSRQTVSRVINERNWVSPASRQRVLEAVRALGYRRNGLAGGLRSGRTHTIGLLISNIVNPLFAGEARGVQDVADANQYQVLLANTDEDLGKEQRLIRMFVEQRVDGAIVIPCHATHSRAALEELVAASIPVVLLNRRVPGFDCVAFDGRLECELAVAHLFEQGHRRLAVVTAPRLSTTARERLDTYRRMLQQRGVDFDPTLVKTAGWSAEDGARATRELLALARPPTAIFATSILLTLGVLTAIKDAGLRIPDDVALVGCNDTPWSRVVDPPLTAVQTDLYALGKMGAELLLQRLQGDQADAPRLVQLPARLEVRASSGAPPFPARDPSAAESLASTAAG